MTNKTVKKLVERLLKHCALRANSVPAREAMEQAATTLTQQAAENEALREALREIERGPIVMFEAGNVEFNERTAIEIARTALTGGRPDR